MQELLLYRLQELRDGHWKDVRVFRPKYEKSEWKVATRRRFLIFTTKETQYEILNEKAALEECSKALEKFVQRRCTDVQMLRVKGTYRKGNGLKHQIEWVSKKKD